MDIEVYPGDPCDFFREIVPSSWSHTFIRIANADARIGSITPEGCFLEPGATAGDSVEVFWDAQPPTEAIDEWCRSQGRILLKARTAW